MRYIKDLHEGDMISEIYYCKQKQSLTTKAGKSYESLILQDKTGLLDAKIWDMHSGISSFEEKDYIRVDGQVILFQNNPQLNVRRVIRCQEGEYDVAEYMPVSRKNREGMLKELKVYIASVKQPHLKALLESYFIKDEAFAKKFMNHSAAKSVHHGFMGGLLEHSLGVVRLCEAMAAGYPLIHRDLLVTAAILHDIGKIDELAPFPVNDYTDDGQLLGHIYLGAQMVGERAKTIEGFPPQLLKELQHCILSHHGELEFGSPKKPALIEAIALSFADNADAKLETMTEALENGKEGEEWLGYHKFLETNIRRTTE